VTSELLGTSADKEGNPERTEVHVDQEFHAAGRGTSISSTRHAAYAGAWQPDDRSHLYAHSADAGLAAHDGGISSDGFEPSVLDRLAGPLSMLQDAVT
jgi:hypothetical protein